MSAARETILQAIAKGRGVAKPVPDYILPSWPGETGAHFITKAKASIAAVHEIVSPEDAPETILSILIADGLTSRLHLPAASPLNALPWHRAPGLTLLPEPPDGNDSAFSMADYGIAETGTLVFFSGPRSASSWHFRPGCEFVLLSRNAILPRVEDIIALIAPWKSMPATLNLVTGPSRTADIEQTIELGAHGPRALHILIAG
ncbi:MAG TPA: LUD domain-containing protein [Micropepsaceae bacterium]|jgi:L-lactate dehydrogenase complex protein LldG